VKDCIPLNMTISNADKESKFDSGIPVVKDFVPLNMTISNADKESKFDRPMQMSQQL